MSSRKVAFGALPWEVPLAGVRQRAAERPGMRLRIVEYTPGMPPHWCEKGHVGVLLAGRLEVRFPDETVVFEEGDGIVILSGADDRHMARALTPAARAFWVEEA